jgi:acyl-CoA thioester hydrolase
MTGNDDWPDLAGRLSGETHLLPVRVYFEDTDFSGMVYHASYLRFMERGRSDFLRLHGIGHDELARGDHGGEALAFAVRRLVVDYLKPGRIDDLLVVQTKVAKLGGASLTLSQEVRRGDQVLVTAEVLVVLLSADGQLRRLPPNLRKALPAPR